MTETIPKWQRVTGWVLSGILALLFLPSAFFKIAQPKGFIEEWSKTYPAGSALPLGVIELTLFVLYLVPKTRYLGGLLMLAYLGGAVATHVHANDGMFFVPVIVGVVAWLGLYLRDRKLRALVPLVAERAIAPEKGTFCCMIINKNVPFSVRLLQGKHPENRAFVHEANNHHRPTEGIAGFR